MRLNISKKTDLAIRACRLLAGADERMSGKTVAEEVGTSVAFLSQALSPLVNEGWIDSRTGPRGGYGLTPAGRRISLLQVIEAVEGPIIDGRCVLEDGLCDGGEPCALHALWLQARKSLMSSLASVKAVVPQT